MEQVLWFEAAMKGVIGLALVAAPMTVLRLFGLHRDNRRFWPRLVGFLLLGIAAGVLFGLLFPSAKGAIGPTGLIALNLAAAAGLFAPLVWGTAAPFRRGRLIILALLLTLLALAFLEIAHA